MYIITLSYYPAAAATAAVIGGVVSGILLLLCLCTICVCVACVSKKMNNRSRTIAVPAHSAPAQAGVVTATTTTTYNAPAQQPPPTHPANQQQIPVNSELQQAPPPAYDAAVAGYPQPLYPAAAQVQYQPQGALYPPYSAYPLTQTTSFAEGGYSQPVNAPYPSNPAYPPPTVQQQPPPPSAPQGYGQAEPVPSAPPVQY